MVAARLTPASGRGDDVRPRVGARGGAAARITPASVCGRMPHPWPARRAAGRAKGRGARERAPPVAAATIRDALTRSPSLPVTTSVAAPIASVVGRGRRRGSRRPALSTPPMPSRWVAPRRGRTVTAITSPGRKPAPAIATSPPRAACRETVMPGTRTDARATSRRATPSALRVWTPPPVARGIVTETPVGTAPWPSALTRARTRPSRRATISSRGAKPVSVSDRGAPGAATEGAARRGRRSDAGRRDTPRAWGESRRTGLPAL